MYWVRMADYIWSSVMKASGAVEGDSVEDAVRVVFHEVVESDVMAPVFATVSRRVDEYFHAHVPSFVDQYAWLALVTMLVFHEGKLAAVPAFAPECAMPQWSRDDFAVSPEEDLDGKMSAFCDLAAKMMGCGTGLSVFGV